jgi:hypothetical protein
MAEATQSVELVNTGEAGSDHQDVELLNGAGSRRGHIALLLCIEAASIHASWGSI